jgi:hypothetical protein
MFFRTIKPPEWWEQQPRCTNASCPGKIVNLKCKFTGQILHCCEECLAIFVGSSTPTYHTPCIGGNCYERMLCLEEDRDVWEITEEDVTPTWDVDHYFKHIYNPHRSPLATKSLTGDKGIEICPYCYYNKFEKVVTYKDKYGHAHKCKLPKENRLQLLFIPQTRQRIQYCRFCNNIYPEYREPEMSCSGDLEVYLALLGVIRFNDL